MKITVYHIMQIIHYTSLRQCYVSAEPQLWLMRHMDLQPLFTKLIFHSGSWLPQCFQMAQIILMHKVRVHLPLFKCKRMAFSVHQNVKRLLCYSSGTLINKRYLSLYILVIIALWRCYKYIWSKYTDFLQWFHTKLQSAFNIHCTWRLVWKQLELLSVALKKITEIHGLSDHGVKSSENGIN